MPSCPLSHSLALPALALSVLVLAACQPMAPGSASAEKSVCLASYNIDHTDIPDDHTIIFTMRDHSVWKNTLAYNCSGLRMDSRGYTYEATDPGSDTICSNLVTIRLNTYRNVCELGEFTQLKGAGHS